QEQERGITITSAATTAPINIFFLYGAPLPRWDYVPTIKDPVDKGVLGMERRGRGRPAYEPNKKDQGIVESLTGFGVPLEQIARLLKLDHKTIQKYYRFELDTGRIKANSQVANSLFQKAIGNGPQSVSAAIFWLKCQAGWKDSSGTIEYVSKKEEAQWAAKRAGLGSEWGDDLTTPPPPSEMN
ncbi:MAG TPA: hypothetical protein VGD41_14345, partial [Pyrinomonadaceae bacterium]